MSNWLYPLIASAMFLLAVVRATTAYLGDPSLRGSNIAIVALLFAVSSLLLKVWTLERRFLRFAESVTEVLECDDERFQRQSQQPTRAEQR